MKYLFLIVASFFIYSFGKAQDKKYTDSAVAEYVEHCKCAFKTHDENGEDFKRIRKTNFYKYVKKILYISFENAGNNNEPYLKDGLLNNEVVKEKHILSDPEIDSLNKTLFNFRYKGTPLKILVFDCGKPENAIIYLDKFNKPIDALNICFSGTGYSVWNSGQYKGIHGPAFGDTCFGKYELIANLFRSAGIKNIK